MTPNRENAQPAEDWLRQLAEKYRREFPDDLARLAAQVDALAVEADPAEKFAALLLTVHRLHGSSGTHGLSEASRILAEWECWLDKHVPAAGLLPQRSITAMRGFLKRLQQELGCNKI